MSKPPPKANSFSAIEDKFEYLNKNIFWVVLYPSM